MVKFNEEIMKKVEQKEKEATYIRRCIAVRTCPLCASDLECESFNDGGRIYRCKCGFKHST